MAPHNNTAEQANDRKEEGVEAPAEQPVPALPDYVLSPDAVLKDKCEWRFGKAPDYTKTRKFWKETKQKSHEPGSLESIAENLVKNWEIEASFKPNIKDWRTIDHEKYTFSVNGGPPQSAKHMAKVGTYNAIITPNEFYSPAGQDFSSSHKVFKRAIPVFAWEVTEVFSGPPVVAAKWRHWGEMMNDLVSINDKDEKVTVKAHGGALDVSGIIIARISAELKIESIEIFQDPIDLFRQMAHKGIVNKVPRDQKVDDATQEVKQYLSDHQVNSTPERHSNDSDNRAHESNLKQIVGKHLPSTNEASSDGNGQTTAQDAYGACPMASVLANAHDASKIDNTSTAAGLWTAKAVEMPPVRTGLWSKDDKTAETEERVKQTSHDAIDEHLKQSADVVHPHNKTTERKVQPAPGEAVVAPANSQETESTRREMSKSFSQSSAIEQKMLNSE